MTGQKALDEMRAIAARESGDPETDHSQADNVLCLLLRTLGFNALIDEYEGIEKWYA